MRTYNKCALNPKGNPEDPTRCIESVSSDGWLSHQCSRKRGHGKEGLYDNITAFRNDN